MELPVRPIDHESLWHKLPDGNADLWREHEYGNNDQKFELISGKLVPRSLSDFRRQSVTFSLIRWAIEAYQEAQDSIEPWLLIEKAPIALGEDILIADLAAWQGADDAEVLVDGCYRRRPDLICLNAYHSYEDNMPVKREQILRRAGVEYFWKVDVSSKNIKAKRLKNGRWAKAGGMLARGKFKAQPFPDLKFQPESLWR